MKIHTPAMSFVNHDAAAEWDQMVAKNTDPYGNAVCRFASEWATQMESRLTSGKTVHEIAQSCADSADSEGITGFMYGCAVSFLAKVWKHGEQLRRWHNKETQIGDEGDRANESGGTLNPALLCVKTK